MRGLPSKSETAFGPTTTETLASGKFPNKMSRTGKVKTTSPTFVSETTRIFLISEFLNFINDLIHLQDFHANIVRAIEVVTRLPIAADIFLKKGEFARSARRGHLRAGRSE